MTSEARVAKRIDERFSFEPHNCFACGTLNAGGLHLDLHVDGERCWTDLSIPTRFQGWDEIAHGGIVSTILDEVMAWALVDTDHWGLTARLAVEFKRPVPLGRPIHAEGWITDARRRIVTTAGRIVDGSSGELLATAEALYVAAPEGRKRELKERYGYREARQPGNGTR
ncbi:MAG TPA: PaaI family thioesterase [Candidatus Limnocylindrales bacterium]|nr:PaaI family thioesterase [Candidatus Limnocylindrales bacterium]